MALVAMGGPGGPQQVRDGVGVAGREMGPPLWANVFTLKTVNTAVQYSSQIVSTHKLPIGHRAELSGLVSSLTKM